MDPTPDPASIPDPSTTPPPPPEGVAPAAGAMEVSKDERMWGMISHLAALAGLTGIPFANVIGPLIVWLVKKEGMPFVDDQGKEALNFQITAAIVAVPLCILSLVPLVFCVTIPLLMVVGLGVLVLTIIGGIKANGGERYRYPFALRLVK